MPVGGLLCAPLEVRRAGVVPGGPSTRFGGEERHGGGGGVDRVTDR
jgi:hypothetical protein